MMRCILLFVTLAGCLPADRQVSIPAPVDSSTSDPIPSDPPPAPSAPPEASNAARALLDAHNQVRRSAGLPELSLNGALQHAAEGHATWMARTGRMSHTGDGGSRFWDRAHAAGYRGRGGGENIAMGYRGVESVIQGWMSSPGHRANILREPFREAGFAVATGPRGAFWCAVFGSPGGPSALSEDYLPPGIEP
jgi:uncharacterized protein YkwD